MSQAEVLHEAEPPLPPQVFGQLSEGDQQCWVDLRTAFTPYRVAGPQLIRPLIDEAYDLPHATAQKLSQAPAVGQHAEHRALSTMLHARNSALHVRIPKFEELAVRLDQDKNYRARLEHHRGNPGPVGWRRVQTAILANVVEMSVGLQRPTPYTKLNGLSG